MQNIIIKTSVENENCILHLLKENSLEAKVFKEEKTAINLAAYSGITLVNIYLKLY